jgi:hypothetical protein
MFCILFQKHYRLFRNNREYVEQRENIAAFVEQAPTWRQ